MQAKRKIEPVIQRSAPRDADGVSYFQDACAEGLRFFRCNPLSATMSTKGCAGRWRESQAATGARGEALETCRSCPIGAAHAGYVHIHHNRLYGLSICPRCDKHAMRIIGGTRCVSCYNREREFRVGKNARGNVPARYVERAATLRTVQLLAIVDGAPRLIRAENVVDAFEPIVQTMRTTKGRLAFACAPYTGGVRRSELDVGEMLMRRPRRLRRPPGLHRPRPVPILQLDFGWPPSNRLAA